jgi:hypothetical protein
MRRGSCCPLSGLAIPFIAREAPPNHSTAPHSPSLGSRGMCLRAPTHSRRSHAARHRASPFHSSPAKPRRTTAMPRIRHRWEGVACACARRRTCGGVMPPAIGPRHTIHRPRSPIEPLHCPAFAIAGKPWHVPERADPHAVGMPRTIQLRLVILRQGLHA